VTAGLLPLEVGKFAGDEEGAPLKVSFIWIKRDYF
jgi:hypothetical protein